MGILDAARSAVYEGDNVALALRLLNQHELPDYVRDYILGHVESGTLPNYESFIGALAGYLNRSVVNSDAFRGDYQALQDIYSDIGFQIPEYKIYFLSLIDKYRDNIDILLRPNVTGVYVPSGISIGSLCLSIGVTPRRRLSVPADQISVNYNNSITDQVKITNDKEFYSAVDLDDTVNIRDFFETVIAYLCRVRLNRLRSNFNQTYSRLNANGGHVLPVSLALNDRSLTCLRPN
jgi:hypothetical protein